ncbi:MAG: hypothetical protein JWM55_761 [Acidimicrobiaceae bacterium]|nr:hypothetical protein [Acidimicrobiaceae bacterium]
METEHWQLHPDEHDYPAAARYLSLICSTDLAARIVKLLKVAPMATYEAKDLLRASRLPMLEHDNKHVASDLAKVTSGFKLSPILLVRGRIERNRDLVVADGYHRICASYYIDENSQIPCRLVELPSK